MPRNATPRKHLPTDAELANDPSLRFCPYRPYETVWSDTHGQELRFLRYQEDAVVLASLNGMGELPGAVPALSIRRLTALPELTAR
jgi:hypothetical protein